MWLTNTALGPLLTLSSNDRSIRILRMELGSTEWSSRVSLKAVKQDAASTQLRSEKVTAPNEESSSPQSDMATCVAFGSGFLVVGTHTGKVAFYDTNTGFS